ncbi:shikimate kinase [Novimethylophilus kurashikiensis]|uniref:Shikimate kinase n=2 Tax=Novimethylophilus kurashikiensis TaxID=1825523 RepID=A0A2R5F789_9PROT|nr:shikimate kinase [Novimethylophilus kurashikiensis]
MKMAGNIFLIGLMGAGKSTVGRLLSKSLDKTFYDSDHEIERKTGVNIPLIFELEGESGFRKRESQAIAELVVLNNIVLATGGGAVLLQENRDALSAHGIVVYLRASVDELWHRTRGDRNRPLLQTENPRERLQTLFSQRDPLYREIADLVIDTGGQPVTSIVTQIEQCLKVKDANA